VEAAFEKELAHQLPRFREIAENQIQLRCLEAGAPVAKIAPLGEATYDEAGGGDVIMRFFVTTEDGRTGLFVCTLNIDAQQMTIHEEEE